MKGLVFGRSGQLAQCLAARLRSLESVSFLDRRQADLSTPEAAARAIESLQPDVVINAAAYTAVDQAETEPELAETVNARAPGAMAEACASTGAWLVHYSTDYVFDGAGERPYTEDDRVNPINVYGRTKLAGEEAIRARHDRSLIFRTSWVYSNHGRNFLNTMLRLARERDRLDIVCDQVGAPTYAGAIAEATDKVLHALATHPSGEGIETGVYHMTCGGRASWHELACRIFELTGLDDAVDVDPIPTSEFPTPAKRPLLSLLCNQKLERIFGVRLEHWDDALRSCLSERDTGQQ